MQVTRALCKLKVTQNKRNKNRKIGKRIYCKNQNLDLEQKRYQCHKARGQSSSKKSYEQKNLGNKVTCRAYFYWAKKVNYYQSKLRKLSGVVC